MAVNQFQTPKCPYKEGLLAFAQNTGGFGEPSEHQSFFLPGSEVHILADKYGIEAVHCIQCGQPRILRVQQDAFWTL